MAFVTCVSWWKLCFTMAAHRVNMHYSTREAVELVLNEGSDLKDFSDSGSEENVVDFGEEFVPVDLKADSSDSDDDIFIFIIGIHATSRIKLFIYCLEFMLCFCDRERYVIWLYGLFIWQVHILIFLKMCMFIILFLVVYLQLFLNRQKQCIYRNWVSFCGILIELKGQ